MLFVVFSIGADRYALPGRELREVLPLARLKGLPKAPAGLAGLLDYHGALVPVLDLNALAMGRETAERITTRILITERQSGLPLGLMAEHAGQILYRSEDDFADAGVETADTPYLGPVTRDESGLVQWVNSDQLMTPDIRECLRAHLPDAA